jgi:hypothetical protein
MIKTILNIWSILPLYIGVMMLAKGVSLQVAGLSFV